MQFRALCYLPAGLWSVSGPVWAVLVEPVFLVQSNLSVSSCSHPHRSWSKLQLAEMYRRLNTHNKSATGHNAPLFWTLWFIACNRRRDIDRMIVLELFFFFRKKIELNGCNGCHLNREYNGGDTDFANKIRLCDDNNQKNSNNDDDCDNNNNNNDDDDNNSQKKK